MSEIATYGWGEWQMDFMADEGDYVRVEDYRKLEQRNKELEALVQSFSAVDKARQEEAEELEQKLAELQAKVKYYEMQCPTAWINEANQRGDKASSEVKE